MASWQFEAIGTQWQIETPAELAADCKATIMRRITDFDRTYSRFRPDSLVAAAAKRAGTYVFPPDALPLFRLYQQLYVATNGEVTPLVGGMLEQAGYAADYSLEQKAPPQSPPKLEQVVAFNGVEVTLQQPAVLDFGAAGKGYLADLVGEALCAEGISSYVIDASGDIVISGDAERIGLEHPKKPGEVIGVAEVANGSICGSAINRRAWGDGLHHIMSPSRQAPANEVLATWVVAASGLLADGLATALFFVGPHTLHKHFDFTFVRILHNGSIEYSPNFKGELF
ncbi:MAG TPA: FAD:protein FMN transferase [Candidatus Saccharimonadales bacterium]